MLLMLFVKCLPSSMWSDHLISCTGISATALDMTLSHTVLYCGHVELPVMTLPSERQIVLVDRPRPDSRIKFLGDILSAGHFTMSVRRSALSFPGGAVLKISTGERNFYLSMSGGPRWTFPNLIGSPTAKANFIYRFCANPGRSQSSSALPFSSTCLFLG